jgi:hypothetical protein
MTGRVILSGLVFVCASLAMQSAHAQVQTSDQQKCINKMNKDGIKVEAAQGKENAECVKRKANNELGNSGMGSGAEACLTADERGKVSGRQGKTTQDQTTFCTMPPNFAFLGAGTVNAVTKQAELDLVHDVFGPAPIDAGLFATNPNVNEAVCQRNAIDRVEKLMQSMGREFVKCKKNALKVGKDPFPSGATSSADIEHCVNDPAAPNSVAADTKGKLAKRKANLLTTITDQCDATGVSAVSFPGTCSGMTGATLHTCLIDLVECRFCKMANAMDGLAVDCNAFKALTPQAIGSCP